MPPRRLRLQGAINTSALGVGGLVVRLGGCTSLAWLRALGRIQSCAPLGFAPGGFGGLPPQRAVGLRHVAIAMGMGWCMVPRAPRRLALQAVGGFVPGLVGWQRQRGSWIVGVGVRRGGLLGRPLGAGRCVPGGGHQYSMVVIPSWPVCGRSLLNNSLNNENWCAIYKSGQQLYINLLVIYRR